MKKICLTITIAVFLLFVVIRVQAQTKQTKLNYIELNSQLAGSWKYENGKDTIGYADYTIYDKGIDAIDKLVSKGKTVSELRINWAYDKTLDKMIGLCQWKGEDVVKLAVAQWISRNKYVLVDYKDISNIVGASTRTEGTLKTHDLLEIINYVNNKPVKTINYTRVK